MFMKNYDKYYYNTRKKYKNMNGPLNINDEVRNVETEMGDTDMTDNNQMEAMMQKHFPDQYVGIFKKNRIPYLEEGQIALVFDGPDNFGHWRVVYRKNGKLKEYDSYNRDKQGKKYEDVKDANPQKDNESNCGQRTIAHLIKVFKKQ